MYDPSAGNWTTVDSMANKREWHTASLLNNGTVLVSGGQTSDAGGYLNSAELYDPSTGNWTTTGNMTNKRSKHTASVLNNGKVLVSGGNSGNSTLTSAELY